ncbi:cytochrome c [Rhodobacter maris]|uniref:Cbb3-type cytochrome c oxidase subunit III n=1 Tax=Rhodobacter maris TaxID=446682 RepID=A0A285SDP2_9RHOB|nr:cytochrome c [Rhodobacter maris]SOC05299.1 cbb3-type cytochrome c oxidase subunit III [Rhodobacter maris]
MRAHMTVFALTLAGLAACAPLVHGLPPAAQDYQDYCAGCHGTGGEPGPIATELHLRPVSLADLTMMNDGNFPEARVMSKIVGHKEHGEMMGAEAGQMPPFEPMLEGPTVLYDSGDGVPTPTPLRLVRLMEYVKGMQK